MHGTHPSSPLHLAGARARVNPPPRALGSTFELASSPPRTFTTIETARSQSGAKLTWADGGLTVARSEQGRGELLVADSWLVADGVVRAYEAHWDRFGSSCLELGVDAGELAAFSRAVTAVLPRRGRWFPRIELIGGCGAGQLGLWIRRAPPPAGAARVWVAGAGDPRRSPTRKGPDLHVLLGVRRAAHDAGADEALLCDDRGMLLEGALSSLLWWEGDVLYTSPDATALPGITRRLLVGVARANGVEVQHVAPGPRRLANREAWLASALHGIRPISAWINADQQAGPAVRATEWQAALNTFSHALSDPTAAELH